MSQAKMNEHAVLQQRGVLPLLAVHLRVLQIVLGVVACLALNYVPSWQISASGILLSTLVLLLERLLRVSPNLSIERTSSSWLRQPPAAAHVGR